MDFRAENEWAEFWIEKEILFFVYKDGVSIDRSIAVKVLKDRLALQEGRPFLIFCDARGVKKIDRAARDYYALEGSVLTIAVALLVSEPLTHALSGFYIKTSRPPIPTGMFTDEEEALAFLDVHKPARPFRGMT